MYKYIFFVLIIIFFLNYYKILSIKKIFNDDNYLTTLTYERKFNTGYIDTVETKIICSDSLKYGVFFENPSKQNPMGSIYIAEYMGAASTKKHYVHSTVINVKILSSNSKKILD